MSDDELGDLDWLTRGWIAIHGSARRYFEANPKPDKRDASRRYKAAKKNQTQKSEVA